MTAHTEAASPHFISLDCDHALNHAGGDPELLMQLCRTFLSELPWCMERLGGAIAARNHQLAGCALLQLQGCILVFGSGHAAVTAEILETAIRNRRSRQVQGEWARLQAQMQHLVPQVERLMLEISTPRTRIQ
jgi:HPt (histidine-containing phosphotransfer) domain-containing protein